MVTSWASSGSTKAARAAGSLSRPTPRRPSSNRSQKDAFIAPRCSSSPGVPARTSRNGASVRTFWLAFSNRRPTSRSSVCASSSRTTSGLLRHRAINPFVRFRSDAPDAGHSAFPTPVTPTLTPRGQELPDAGRRQQLVDQRLPAPHFAGRYPLDVHTAIAAGALEPVKQHGLAVAAGAGQHDVVRRGVAAGQVGETPRQYRLLALASGERRRECAVAGLEHVRDHDTQCSQPAARRQTALWPARGGLGLTPRKTRLEKRTSKRPAYKNGAGREGSLPAPERRRGRPPARSGRSWNER